ncbi:hypothetical protein QBC40DRAFT_352037 [Triangularia verruculosa]|uniref:Uncharacterized protein n=1 Tax=Triangularia verruculosa TaxID=2587418 RepID=A0AAN6X9E6_9PEZI|nr:hypothetical protein QBC40DRAFT_352037 [Triangularia verruculosa]
MAYKYNHPPEEFTLEELMYPSDDSLRDPLTRQPVLTAQENVDPEHIKRLRALWDPQPLGNRRKKDLDRIDAENTFMRSQLDIAVKFIEESHKTRDLPAAIKALVQSRQKSAKTTAEELKARIHDVYSERYTGPGAPFNPAMLRFLDPIRKMLDLDDPNAAKEAYNSVVFLSSRWYDRDSDHRYESGYSSDDFYDDEDDFDSESETGESEAAGPQPARLKDIVDDNEYIRAKFPIKEHDDLLDKLFVEVIKKRTEDGKRWGWRDRLCDLNNEADDLLSEIGVKHWFPKSRELLQKIEEANSTKEMLVYEPSRRTQKRVYEEDWGAGRGWNCNPKLLFVVTYRPVLSSLSQHTGWHIPNQIQTCLGRSET